MHLRRSRPAVVAALLAATLLVAAGPVSAATPPIGKWALKGNLQNSAGTNLKLTKLGAPTWENTNTSCITRKAFRFGEGDGLTLTGIPRAARKTYTIDVQFYFEDLTGYRRILSFGPNDEDPGLYLYDGALSLYDHKQADYQADPSTCVQVRVTRNGATGTMRVYLDWGLYITFKDTANEYLLRNGEVDFFQDNGSEHPSGAANRILFFNQVVPPPTGGHD